MNIVRWVKALSVAFVSLTLMLTGTASADSMSLENRLREFNSDNTGGAVKKAVAKTSKKVRAKKVSKRRVKKKARTKKVRNSRGPRLRAACYGSSANAIKRRAAHYRDAIDTYSERYDVPRALIVAVITAESCFRERANSHKSARGLMQLIPATAKRFGVRDRYNPTQNIMGGVRYLAFLLKRYPGKLQHSIAAYNAGEGAVDRFKGIPPYRETRQYVKRVTSVYKRLQGHTTANELRYLQSVRTTTPAARGRVSATYAVRPAVARSRTVAARPIRVKRRQQPRRESLVRSCDRAASVRLRNTTNLRKGAKGQWQRYYKVPQLAPLSAVSKSLGVPLPQLLRLNPGIKNIKVKKNTELRVWQCIG